MSHLCHCVLLFAIAVAPPSDEPAKPDRAEIDRHIRQLGSDRFSEREAASKALEAIGEPTLDALRKAAATSTDVEIRRRAEALVETIERSQYREVRRFQGHTAAVDSVAFSPDGRRALSASQDRTLRLWDVETGKSLHQFTGHRAWVYSVAFSPDGRRFLSGGEDGTAHIWDVNSDRGPRSFEGHTGAVNGVAFSPDGQWAVTGSGDMTVRRWRLPK